MTNTSEPTSIHAGDTWTWTRNLADYPAGTWSLTYHLRNAAAFYNIAASASGTTHSVSVAAATTAAYKPGWYDWIARVTGTAGTFTADAGRIQILPNLGATGALDGRSSARKALDAIDAVLANRATHDQASYSIANRSLSRMSPEELLTLRSHFSSLVVAEDKAARLAKGLGTGKLQVRF